jgi:hypothetical protein
MTTRAFALAGFFYGAFSILHKPTFIRLVPLLHRLAIVVRKAGYGPMKSIGRIIAVRNARPIGTDLRRRLNGVAHKEFGLIAVHEAAQIDSDYRLQLPDLDFKRAH